MEAARGVVTGGSGAGAMRFGVRVRRNRGKEETLNDEDLETERWG